MRGRGSEEALEDLSPRLGRIAKQVQLKIQGGLLQGSVHLRTCCVLLAPDSNDPLAPKEPGSLIWRTSQEVLLEGSGARFPIEVQKFAENEKFAGWSLSILDDFDWPFLGGVRLFVNANNERVGKAVATEQPGEAEELVRSSIYYDVGRQLVATAVASDEFRERFDTNRNTSVYAANSIGNALWALLNTFVQDKSASELNALRVTDPSRFESLMQHRFRIFGATHV